MDYSDRLDPVFDDDEFKEVCELLFCHGLHKDWPYLLRRISQRHPQILEFSSPHRHVLSLLAFCQKFQREGPLPAIRDTLFLHTLHEGVTGILKSEDQLVEAMTSEKTLSLVVGLRSLLTRSLLHNHKYTVKDIETTVSGFFPVLPVRPSNSHHWDSLAQILKIDLEEESEVLTKANSVNKISEKHFRDKLNNLAVERRKIIVDESITSIWQTFEDKFSDFVKQLKGLLPQNFLMKVVKSSHPKMTLTTERIRLESEPDEEDVIEYFDYICDLYIESKFWASDFVRKKISINEFTSS